MADPFLPARDIVSHRIAADRQLLACITLALIVIVTAAGVAGAVIAADRVNRAVAAERV